MPSHRLDRTPFSTAAALAGLGLALLVAVAGPASAHSILKDTSPKRGAVVREPPSEVVLVFNEPVELALGGIRVLGPDGSEVEVGGAEHARGDRTRVRAALPSHLANGRYRVTWRIIAADGHPRQGSFRFTVRAPQPAGSPGPSPTHAPPSPAGEAPAVGHGEAGAGAAEGLLLGVTRFLTFASLLLMSGLLVFVAAVWRPAALPERPPEVEAALRRRLEALVSTSLAGAAVAAVASLPLQGAVAGDLSLGGAFSPRVLGAVLGTRFGLTVAARLALLLLAAAGWWALLRGASRHPSPLSLQPRSLGAAVAAPRLPAVPLVLLAVLALALLGTVGWSGHAGTTPPVALNVTADLLHLAGAAAWAGGLVALAAVAFPATASLPRPDRLKLLAPVVTRFSDLALVSVIVLAASGLLRAWIEVRSLPGLTGYDYGVALLVKMAVFLPLVGLGAVNNRWLKPRIRRAAVGAGSERAGQRALELLRRSVVVEVVLVAVVLGITAVLVNLPPPRLGPVGGH